MAHYGENKDMSHYDMPKKKKGRFSKIKSMVGKRKSKKGSKAEEARAMARKAGERGVMTDSDIESFKKYSKK